MQPIALCLVEVYEENLDSCGYVVRKKKSTLIALLDDIFNTMPKPDKQLLLKSE